METGCIVTWLLLKRFQKSPSRFQNSHQCLVSISIKDLLLCFFKAISITAVILNGLKSVLPLADSTGTHSLYTTYQGYEVMFHVSTMLPYMPNNPQQVRASNLYQHCRFRLEIFVCV